MKRLVTGIICISSITWGSANALPSFLPAWQAQYPESTSDETNCQLCHVRPGGGSPWNGYGIVIRNVLEAQAVLGGGASAQDLEEAFRIAESGDPDSDPSGATSLEEINNGYQPGWTEGAANTITSVVDDDPDDQIPPVRTVTLNQLPPTFNSNTIRLDPPRSTTNNLPRVQNGSIAIELETVSSGFTGPVMAARAPGLSDFLFVVEQTGKIWRVRLSDGSRVLFHDVGSDGLGQLVPGSGNDERGLLGLAFHPDYLDNGYFYTYQSEAVDSPGAGRNHQTVVSEWITNEPASELFSVSSTRRVVLEVVQPQSNHNGGMLNFGPDGFLYIALGDGGAADDQGTGHGTDGNARDNTNLLGSILRIDPRSVDGPGGNYGIPMDNPFAGDGDAGRDEIYAYGFRNPYRFSFDQLCFEEGQSCNTLIAGDVGQNQVEEIDDVVMGGNYGWNWKEGSFFFYPPTPGLNNGRRFISLDPPPGVPSNLIDPIAEYRRSDGRSAIGGYVYRGSAIPELVGRYVFADFYQSLYYLDENNAIRRFLLDQDSDFIGGFGEGHDQELYVLSRSLGALQKLIPSDAPPQGDELCVPVKSQNGSIAVICL